MATRQERKAIQRAHFAELDRISAMSAERREAISAQKREERLRFEREHPVTAGIIPLVEYQEPKWSYRP